MFWQFAILLTVSIFDNFVGKNVNKKGLYKNVSIDDMNWAGVPVLVVDHYTRGGPQGQFLQTQCTRNKNYSEYTSTKVSTYN